MAQAANRQPQHHGYPCLIRGKSVWDLWWTEWHWDTFFQTSSVSFVMLFHQCSVFVFHSSVTNAIYLYCQQLIC